MRDKTLVQIVNCAEKLLHQVAHIFLADQQLLARILEEVPARTNFGYDVEVCFVVVDFQELDDIRVVEGSKNHQFRKKVLLLCFDLGLRNDFDRSWVMAELGLRSEDRAVGALAQLHRKAVFFVNILTAHSDKTFSFYTVNHAIFGLGGGIALNSLVQFEIGLD